MSDTSQGCVLCTSDRDQEEILWRNASCRIVLVDDDDYPGYCRVVLRRHIPEMTDLAPAERGSLMEIVFGVEAALRETLRPDKINLASLGNQTPHLHWHVIPRWRNDRCFPDPIWAPARRHPALARPAADSEALRRALILPLGPPEDDAP